MLAPCYAPPVRSHDGDSDDTCQISSTRQRKTAGCAPWGDPRAMQPAPKAASSREQQRSENDVDTYAVISALMQLRMVANRETALAQHEPIELHGPSSPTFNAKNKSINGMSEVSSAGDTRMSAHGDAKDEPRVLGAISTSWAPLRRFSQAAVQQAAKEELNLAACLMR